MIDGLVRILVFQGIGEVITKFFIPLVPGPVREGLVSLEPGDQVLGSGRVDAPLPRIREARPAGFPESEAQVVTNRRWTVVVVLSEFGR